MSRKKSIIIWTSVSIVTLIGAVVAFGYWFLSLLPTQGDRVSLENMTPEDLPYVSENVIASRGKILAVVTSAEQMGTTGKNTGYELTEVSRAYYVFQANGFEVDIASPLGGEPPVIIDDEDMGPYDYAFLNDPVAQAKVIRSIRVADVNPDDYEAVYFAGGKGAMFDFPDNIHIKEIVRDYYESGKVVGAVCHGPAALVNVKLTSGASLLSDKTVCGFTNNEELFLIPDALEIFPFLLQDKLVEQGARFSDGQMYLENVSVDGNLVTGQNPWSTWTAVEAMISQLGYEPKQRQRSLQEHTIDVLGVYEKEGYDQAKTAIDELYLIKSQEMDRTLLAMHGIVATMQWELGKFVDLVRLLHYTKSVS